MCVSIYAAVSRPMLIGASRLRTPAWSQLRLELCACCSSPVLLVCVFVCGCHFVLAVFHRGSCFSRSKTHTHTHSRTACSLTRGKETQGEAAHLTGIQLSVSNGGHPGEEEGEADLQWWRRAEGNFLRELVPFLPPSPPLALPRSFLQLSVAIQWTLLQSQRPHTFSSFHAPSISLAIDFPLLLISI